MDYNELHNKFFGYGHPELTEEDLIFFNNLSLDEKYNLQKKAIIDDNRISEDDKNEIISNISKIQNFLIKSDKE